MLEERQVWSIKSGESINGRARFPVGIGPSPRGASDLDVSRSLLAAKHYQLPLKQLQYEWRHSETSCETSILSERVANCEERTIPVLLFLNTECPTAEHLASTRPGYAENNTLWIRDNSGGLEGAEG
jgi:hypothetical protein